MEEVDRRCIPVADVSRAVDPRPVGEDHEVSYLEKLDSLLVLSATEDECPPCSPFAPGEHKRLHGSVVKEVLLLVWRRRLALLCGNQDGGKDGLRVVVRPFSQCPVDPLKVDGLVPKECLRDRKGVVGTREGVRPLGE